jgi:hypothetical protein
MLIKVIPLARRDIITDRLEKESAVVASTLAMKFKASEDAIRRDRTPHYSEPYLHNPKKLWGITSFISWLKYPLFAIRRMIDAIIGWHIRYF